MICMRWIQVHSSAHILITLFCNDRLFGVYDAAQIPAKRALNALFSGGAEGCLGSVDYNMCAETFLYNNPPPGPSMDAQARALLTMGYSVWSRLGLDTFPSVDAQARAFFTMAYSIWSRLGLDLDALNLPI